MRLLARRLAEARNTIAKQNAQIQGLKAELDCYGLDYVTELERQVKDFSAQLADLKASRSDDTLLADLRRRLYLSERARASLDAQILTLQTANEATARTEYDRRWAA